VELIGRIFEDRERSPRFSPVLNRTAYLNSAHSENSHKNPPKPSALGGLKIITKGQRAIKTLLKALGLHWLLAVHFAHYGPLAVHGVLIL
jgi:hypothetical protein